MKIHYLQLFILLAFFSASSSSRDLSFDTPETSRLYKQEDTHRIVLIGFEDQYINRVDITSLSSSYRRRGLYQSSSRGRQISSQIENEYNLLKLTEWPMTEVGVHCAVYLVPETLSMEKTVTLLAKDKRIDIVQKMHQFRTRHHPYNDPYFKLQANIHEMQIDLAHTFATGRNIRIAMIDTGVDMDHPDLMGQISINENFASGVSSSFSTDVHGTAIAGVLVARSDNQTGIIGVAPNAKLIALKACWPDKVNSFESKCNSFTLALAVNKAIKLGVNVLNMSLSGPPDPLLGLLLNKAIEKGIIVIAADPGNTSNNLRFPASMKNVIPVQVLQKPGLETTLKNQSINAPGKNILTTLPHGTYDFVSGSSLSAAQISGIVALMLEIKPDLSLDEIKLILQKAVLATDSNANKNLILGVNANKAIAELCNETACPKYVIH